uniref:Uncharacterized protein n=1 Tax=Zooxanthella nutricula TaxID=1333877 RepID=A0A6U6IVC0_9DINO
MGCAASKTEGTSISSPAVVTSTTTLLEGEASTKRTAAAAAGGERAVAEEAPKRVAIDDAAVRAKEEAEAQLGAAELAEVRRTRQRKSTPFVKPGDAQLVDDEDSGDSDAEGKKVVISDEAIRLKEETEANADAEELARVRRTRQRKSTPFCKLGDAAAIEDDDDDEDADGAASDQRKAIIAEEAIRAKEEAEARMGADELAEVRRTRQRKSTPFCKASAATAMEDEDEEDSSAGGSDAGRKVVFSHEAIRAKEEAEAKADSTELAQIRRSRQRKSTPFVKSGGAAAFVDEDEEDGDGEQTASGAEATPANSTSAWSWMWCSSCKQTSTDQEIFCDEVFHDGLATANT